MALDHIDEIISIIRASSSVDDAKASLIVRFGFDDVQAQAIVDMRLRALTGLERSKLQGEYDELESKIAEFMAILSNENILYGVIKEELLIIKTKYGDPRRTYITHEEGEINLEDLIKDEQCVVTITNLGYVKRTSLDMYRSQNRGGKGIKGVETRKDDYVQDLFVCSSHDYLLFFTTKGRVYRLRAFEIPEAGRTAKGTAIVNLLQLNGDEQVCAGIKLKDSTAEDGYLIMATRQGIVKKTALAEYNNIRTNGLNAIALQDDDMLISVKRTNGKDEIFLASNAGQMIRFFETDVRPTGRSTIGVKGMTLPDGAEIIGMSLASEGDSILVVSENGMGKRTSLSEFSVQKRGGKGVLFYKVTDKTGGIVTFRIVSPDQDLLIITSAGIIIRTPVNSINQIGRITSGVKLMSLADDVNIVSVALAQQAESDTSEETQETEE